MPVSTERLRNYHVGLKGWITDASPCMVYPHGEHTPEFESESTEVPVERQEFGRPSYMIEPFMNPSDYQYGPETYLLGVWERYGISVYKPKRQIKGEFIEITMTTTRKVIDGVTPSFREKPKDLALTEREPFRISCLIASQPRATIQRLKNDLIFMYKSRLKII